MNVREYYSSALEQGTLAIPYLMMRESVGRPAAALIGTAPLLLL